VIGIYDMFCQALKFLVELFFHTKANIGFFR
jgi:hypothetical protein